MPDSTQYMTWRNLRSIKAELVSNKLIYIHKISYRPTRNINIMNEMPAMHSLKPVYSQNGISNNSHMLGVIR